ncbi:MAG: hypothetical protein QMD80_00570 [archaeon]|nr:hypothetical protein [archaeon]
MARVEEIIKMETEERVIVELAGKFYQEIVERSKKGERKREIIEDILRDGGLSEGHIPIILALASAISIDAFERDDEVCLVCGENIEVIEAKRKNE